MLKLFSLYQYYKITLLSQVCSESSKSLVSQQRFDVTIIQLYRYIYIYYNITKIYQIHKNKTLLLAQATVQQLPSAGGLSAYFTAWSKTSLTPFPDKAEHSTYPHASTSLALSFPSSGIIGLRPCDCSPLMTVLSPLKSVFNPTRRKFGCFSFCLTRSVHPVVKLLKETGSTTEKHRRYKFAFSYVSHLSVSAGICPNESTMYASLCWPFLRYLE